MEFFAVTTVLLRHRVIGFSSLGGKNAPGSGIASADTFDAFGSYFGEVA